MAKEERVSQYAVAFTVNGIPDSAGLRIRSTDPVGLYVSVKEPEAAKRAFEFYILELIAERGVLRVEAGAGLRIEPGALDWDRYFIEGKGACTVYAMSLGETREAQVVGERLYDPPLPDAHVGRWAYPNQEIFFLVGDHGGIDSWLLEEVKKDVPQKQT